MRRRPPASSTIEEPTINITPLIDVVFVVLIMFIVIAPLLEIDRLELAQGSSAREEIISLRDNKAIKLSVSKDNQIKLNNVPIKMGELEILLREAHQNSPQIPLQLYHDEDAPFGTYQKIKNAAEAVGYNNLDVIVKPR